jgi:hypothetical protein
MDLSTGVMLGLQVATTVGVVVVERLVRQVLAGRPEQTFAGVAVATGPVRTLQLEGADGVATEVQTHTLRGIPRTYVYGGVTYRLRHAKGATLVYRAE